MGADLFLPGSGKLVNSLGSALLNKLGLSEKVVLPGEFGSGPGTNLHMGGPVVASADAPVAFGRDEQLNSFVRVLHREPNGDVIVHSKEMVIDVPLAGAASTLKQTQVILTPNQTVLPLARQVAQAYQNYRVLAAKLHFVHYAPTSTQGRVSLMYVNDPEQAFHSDGSYSMSFPQMSRLSDFAVGSCYEDFALEFYPLARQSWYDTLPNGSTFDDTTYQGAFGVATDQNVSTNVNVGTIYLELVVAYKSTRSPDYTFTATIDVASSKHHTHVQKAQIAYQIFMANGDERAIQTILVNNGLMLGQPSPTGVKSAAVSPTAITDGPGVYPGAARQ